MSEQFHRRAGIPGEDHTPTAPDDLPDHCTVTAEPSGKVIPYAITSPSSSHIANSRGGLPSSTGQVACMAASAGILR